MRSLKHKKVDECHKNASSPKGWRPRISENKRAHRLFCRVLSGHTEGWWGNDDRTVSLRTPTDLFAAALSSAKLIAEASGYCVTSCLFNRYHGSVVALNISSLGKFSGQTHELTVAAEHHGTQSLTVSLGLQIKQTMKETLLSHSTRIYKNF